MWITSNQHTFYVGLWYTKSDLGSKTIADLATYDPVTQANIKVCWLYRIRTNIGEELNLVNRYVIAKFKSRQYFFYNISIVTLVAFEWFCQINISLNPLFQQIAK